jgi:uncharacterized protein YnzC (UPF0291/DUF896 family)
VSKKNNCHLKSKAMEVSNMEKLTEKELQERHKLAEELLEAFIYSARKCNEL